MATDENPVRLPLPAREQLSPTLDRVNRCIIRGVPQKGLGDSLTMTTSPSRDFTSSMMSQRGLHRSSGIPERVADRDQCATPVFGLPWVWTTGIRARRASLSSCWMLGMAPMQLSHSCLAGH